MEQKKYHGLGILLLLIIFIIPGTIGAILFPGVIIPQTNFFMNWFAWTFLLFVGLFIIGWIFI